jgi:two-component system nitrate/nitrite response regulator NarL
MTDLVLCDDHTVFVDALRTVLTPHGFTIRGVAACAAAIVETVRAQQPAVCLLDQHFADGDGVEKIGELVAASTGTKVLVLTADHDSAGMRRALEYGAVGYVHKSRGVAALITAIRRVMSGEIVVDVPTGGRPRRSDDAAEAHRLAAYLTARERECLGLLVEGLGTREMGARLGVSVATVRTHVQALLTKLGVHSRLEAASFAVRNSVLRPDS